MSTLKTYQQVFHCHLKYYPINVEMIGAWVHHWVT